MDIDIKTVALLVVITHLIQIAVFAHQYRINKTYKGVGWWLMWSCFITGGISIFVLRSIVTVPPIVIIIQNVVIISGTLFIYIGLMKFLGKEVNRTIIISIFTVFFLPLIYFLIIDNNIQIRTILINSTLAFIAFFTAISFYRNKIKSISSTANFIVVTFLIHGLVFTFISYETIFEVKSFALFLPEHLSIVQLFDPLMVGLLWTFGFVMMLNQRLNAEMKEAKEHFEQIFNTSPDAAIISRLEDGFILNLNEGYTNISGFTREETLGKSSLGMNIYKDTNDRAEVVRKLQELGYCDNYEATFVKKDGGEITGLVSAKVIELNGEHHIISITRDITERKKIEQKVNDQNEELKTLNSEKDKFFSIIAHDLRSPFNAFLGLTELMAKNLRNFKLDEIQNIATKLNHNANNLYRLLTNLLEWSKIQRGLTDLNPESLIIKNIIQNSFNVFKETAQQKGIEVTIEIKDDLYIFADKAMFETIMRNLISNALKFTDKGGRISISAERNGEQSIISVSDTGIGMNKELLDDLFKIDKQTSRKGTDNEASTGLGLLLCKEFTKKLNGNIYVESEEGKGSRFTVSFPTII